MRFDLPGSTMPTSVENEVLRILRSVLQLDPRSAGLDAESELLGSVPELDSMAVVSVLTAIEEHFGVTVDDDEIDGRTFASVRSLTTFVERKLEQ